MAGHPSYAETGAPTGATPSPPSNNLCHDPRRTTPARRSSTAWGWAACACLSIRVRRQANAANVRPLLTRGVPPAPSIPPWGRRASMGAPRHLQRLRGGGALVFRRRFGRAHTGYLWCVAIARPLPRLGQRGPCGSGGAPWARSTRQLLLHQRTAGWGGPPGRRTRRWNGCAGVRSASE